jgi:hypothetical protein
MGFAWQRPFNPADAVLSDRELNWKIVMALNGL